MTLQVLPGYMPISTRLLQWTTFSVTGTMTFGVGKLSKERFPIYVWRMLTSLFRKKLKAESNELVMRYRGMGIPGNRLPRALVLPHSYQCSRDIWKMPSVTCTLALKCLCSWTQWSLKIPSKWATLVYSTPVYFHKDIQKWLRKW